MGNKITKSENLEPSIEPLLESEKSTFEANFDIQGCFGGFFTSTYNSAEKCVYFLTRGCVLTKYDLITEKETIIIEKFERPASRFLESIKYRRVQLYT